MILGLVCIGALAAALSGCRGARESTETEAVTHEPGYPPTLSDKAAVAKEDLRTNIGEFFLALGYHNYNEEFSCGLQLYANPEDKSNPQDGWSSAAVSREQADSILEHLARSGLLDKTAVPPPGEPPTGWSMYCGRYFWYLDRELAGILTNEDIMGIRLVLSDAAAKAMNDLLEVVRRKANQAQPDAAADKPRR